MPQIYLIQGSLSKKSKTAIVLKEISRLFKKFKIPCETIDLRKIKNMEFCDGRPLKKYSDSMVKVYKKLESGQGFVFGMPVYCYSISGVLKNFIEITSNAYDKKFAGIVCNAGGKHSYMSSADLDKVLAYECHATTIQPIVYTNYEDFDDKNRLISEKAHSKIEEMVQSLIQQLNI